MNRGGHGLHSHLYRRLSYTYESDMTPLLFRRNLCSAGALRGTRLWAEGPSTVATLNMQMNLPCAERASFSCVSKWLQWFSCLLGVKGTLLSPVSPITGFTSVQALSPVSPFHRGASRVSPRPQSWGWGVWLGSGLWAEDCFLEVWG